MSEYLAWHGALSVRSHALGWCPMSMRPVADPLSLSTSLHGAVASVTPASQLGFGPPMVRSRAGRFLRAYERMLNEHLGGKPGWFAAAPGWHYISVA